MRSRFVWLMAACLMMVAVGSAGADDPAEVIVVEDPNEVVVVEDPNAVVVEEPDVIVEEPVVEEPEVVEPVVAAENPNPADGAVDRPDLPVLSWTSGTAAVEHVVYLGSDKAKVEARDESTLQGSTADTFFVPAALTWKTTYYWAVDEVGEDPNEIVAGAMWSFTVADFVVVLEGPETLEYDNALEPFTTELIIEPREAQDWTKNGVNSLQLEFKGQPEVLPEPVDPNDPNAVVDEVVVLAFGDPNEAVEPNEPAAEDPNAVVEDPNAVVEDPNAVVEDPNAVVEDPNAVVEDPNAVVVVEDPNAVVEDPNAVVEDPNAVVEDPNAVVEDPNAVVEDPNAVVGDPNAVVEDPNAVVVEPNEPVVEPNEPVVEPNEPVVEPNEPVVEPNEPEEPVEPVHVPPVINSPAPLYVAVVDAAGNQAVVPHPGNPNAVLNEDWTTWKIHTSLLAGLDLKNITSVIIGVGDVEAGGTGVIEVRNVRVVKPFSITVKNASFETVTLPTASGTAPNTCVFAQVANWSTDSKADKSGSTTKGMKTNGSRVGFLYGPDPAVWQVTDHTIVEGEVFEVKVDAYIWGGPIRDGVNSLKMVLFYDNDGVRVPVATKNVKLTSSDNWTRDISLTFSTSAARDAVGCKLGVEFDGISDNTVGLDNVRLAVK